MKTKLAATLLMAVCGISLMGAAPANAGPGTQNCRTHPYPGGTETDCQIFTDDGGWQHSTTYCNNNGNCTTNGF
jgi:hypothetical protein